MNSTSRRITATVGASAVLGTAVAIGAVNWPQPVSDDTGGVVAVLETDAGEFTVHGNDRLPPKPVPLTPEMGPEVGWPCEGDGTDGKRIQLLYAGPNLDSLRPSFETYARRMEARVALSVNGERLIRFVTDADCALSILPVSLSPQGLSNFNDTINELAAQGFNDPNRKYHVWTESTAYCGIGTVLSDDRPGPTNANVTSTGYARSDRACWDYAELHEILHNLGAVQLSAPNSTGAWHCKDRYDVMCYADGGPNDAQVTQCGNLGDRERLDCRDDDYFSIAPSESSYLGSHLNVAASPFLASGVTPTTSVPPTTVPPPTTLPPTTTTTVGKGDTDTDLSVAGGSFRVMQDVDFTARVTGDCGPAGVVEFRVSGKEVARIALAGDTARATLRFARSGRFTIRANYLGSDQCDVSTDSVRKRVTGA